MKLFSREVHVYIVSDATGVTAERVIKAALVQFSEIKPIYEKFPYIQTTQQADIILDKAEKYEAIIIYSIVSKELRDYFHKKYSKEHVYAIDLLGPLLHRLERLWDLIPVFRPGLLRSVDAVSMQLAESIDYTLKHDDGQGIGTLGDADLIIIGISRTSKTPTSIFLSCNNNLKVANIPIIPNEQPPEELFTLKKKKYGFTISPEKVAFIRKKRFFYAGPADYSDLKSIRQELRFCHNIFKQIKGLQVIDVTNSSIEEIADKIMSGY